MISELPIVMPVRGLILASLNAAVVMPIALYSLSGAVAMGEMVAKMDLTILVYTSTWLSE